MKTQNKLQERLKDLIDQAGSKVLVNKKLTKEFVNYSFTVKKFDYFLDTGELAYVNAKILNYTKYFKRILNTLDNDIHSRQAVLSFNITNTHKPNCVVLMQFLIRDEKLHTIVYSRSLDILKKLYTDIDIARRFSDKVCDRYFVTLDKITFHVASLHYYLEDLK